MDRFDIVLGQLEREQRKSDRARKKALGMAASRRRDKAEQTERRLLRGKTRRAS